MKIQIGDHPYGPNPFPIRQGGTLYYRFDVKFVADNPEVPPPTPPTEFNWTVRMSDGLENPVKTVTGTTPTNGESTVSVRVNFPPTKDSGGPLAFGNYGNDFEVSASGYPTYNQRLCTGRPIVPEDCDCAGSCKV